MKKQPLVSIIMSTKDTEESMLRKSIESILEQEYKNFEFFIVCDGSEKDLKIIKTYKDNRIVIIEHKESKGLTISLNECLKIVKGKYIARMDSDDIALKCRLKVQVDFLEKNTNIDICSTFIEYIGEKKGILIDVFNKPKDKKAELFIYNKIVHSSVMIKKSFLDEGQIEYNEKFRFSQDYELWSRCCMIANIEVIPRVCMQYRVHKAQISTAKRKEQNELCRDIFKRQIKNLNLNDDKEILEVIFFLSKKSNRNYTYKEVKKVIKKILENNKKYNIYSEKSIKKVLYYRLFVMKYKEINFLELIDCIFQGKLIKLAIKKEWFTIKCKIVGVFF